MLNLLQNVSPFALPWRGRLLYALALIPLLGSVSPSLYATISQVQLGTSPAAPQLLGTTVHLTASAMDTDPGPVTYKWEVQQPGSSTFSTLEDFDLDSTFTWSPHYTEGTYQLRLTARDYLAGTSAQVVVSYQVNPLVTGSQPVAVKTSHPLVALLSAPTCAAGSTMSVAFEQQGSSAVHTTAWQPCHTGSMNFYVAGMAASKNYTLTYQVKAGATVTPGPSVSFTTGVIPTGLSFPTMTIPVPAGPLTSTADSLVLNGYAEPPQFPTATDLTANIIWYYPAYVQLTRPVPGGTMLSIPNGQGTGTGPFGPGITQEQIVRESDLVGNIVHQTNCDRTYEQLEALGLSDPLSMFDHDAIRLANGETIALGMVQRIFPAGTQGSAVPIDIIGTLIVLLDSNFQVLSYWNSFDHDCTGANCLNINRKGNYTCKPNAQGFTGGGCPPVLLSSPANDWLHANSIEYLPSDGDLLVSLRDQNWVVKIDWENGAGTNGILWRLGVDGDFTAAGVTGITYPWFSGQHDAGFVDNQEQTFLIFDDGTTRVAQQGGDSRGQVWSINQATLVATLELNQDLGTYSPSLGSAQQLQNGNYMFLSGNIMVAKDTIEVQNVEFTPTGTDAFEFESTGPAPSYRGWRMPDLYHGVLNGSSGPM